MQYALSEQQLATLPEEIRTWAIRLRDALRSACRTGWIIVDLIMESERYGEEVYQVLEWLGVTHEEFMRWQRIGKAFPPALRNENLSIYHHEELMRKTLPEHVRVEMLKVAQEKQLKRDEVRKMVKEYRLNVEKKYTETSPPDFPKQDVVATVLNDDGAIEVRDSRTANSFHYAYESFKAQMIGFFLRHPQFLDDAITSLQKIKFDIQNKK